MVFQVDFRRRLIQRYRPSLNEFDSRYRQFKLIVFRFRYLEIQNAVRIFVCRKFRIRRFSRVIIRNFRIRQFLVRSRRHIDKLEGSRRTLIRASVVYDTYRLTSVRTRFHRCRLDITARLTAVCEKIPRIGRVSFTSVRTCRHVAAEGAKLTGRAAFGRRNNFYIHLRIGLGRDRRIFNRDDAGLISVTARCDYPYLTRIFQLYYAVFIHRRQSSIRTAPFHGASVRYRRDQRQPVFIFQIDCRPRSIQRYRPSLNEFDSRYRQFKRTVFRFRHLEIQNAVRIFVHRKFLIRRISRVIRYFRIRQFLDRRRHINKLEGSRRFRIRASVVYDTYRLTSVRARFNRCRRDIAARRTAVCEKIPLIGLVNFTSVRPCRHVAAEGAKLTGRAALRRRNNFYIVIFGFARRGAAIRDDYRADSRIIAELCRNDCVACRYRGYETVFVHRCNVRIGRCPQYRARRSVDRLYRCRQLHRLIFRVYVYRYRIFINGNGSVDDGNSARYVSSVRQRCRNHRHAGRNARNQTVLVHNGYRLVGRAPHKRVAV